MTRSLFWTTFLTVFLAEVGDKTQLAAMTATARSGALWTVFFAASLALVCATAIGVAVGGALFKVVPEHLIKYVAGSAFIAVGLWVLIKG
ncbi:MAG TPA: TMEM165/GDT1 family protein [Holophagaceae bacterium]|nr:TMEM165/GDT1 family protein [Holophagaceae bacterium]